MEIDLMNDETKTAMSPADERLQLKNRIAELEHDLSVALKDKETLWESEEKYRHLFENAGEGILIARGDAIEFANPAFAKILGQPTDIIRARPFVSFIHPDDREMVLNHHLRRMRGEPVGTGYDFRIITADGHERWLHINSQVIPWGGTPASLSFVMDITDRKRAEETFRESDDKFRQIVERSNDVFYRQDMNSAKFDYVSPRVHNLLGYSPDEILMMGIEEQKALFHPDDLPGLVNFLSELIEADARGERFIEREFRFKHRQGEYRWVHGNYTLIRDKDHRPQLVVGSLNDITGRKQMERVLGESEERFRSFVENANDIVYTLSLDGIFTYISPNWTESLGHDVCEVEGRSYEIFVNPEDLPQCRAFLEQAIVTGEKQAGVEYRVHHKSGAWQWHTSNVALIRNADGKIVSCLGIDRDITNRKRAEEALRESEEKYRILLDESTDPIFSFASDGRYLYVNRAFANGVGKKIDEIIGNKIWDVFPRDEADKRFAALKYVFASGEGKVIESRVPRSDGDRFYITTITPIKDERGKVLNAICSSKLEFNTC